MNDIKQQVLREIEKTVPIFIRSSPIQYRIRCPICGDSQKNRRDTHCYIKCSMDPTEPLLYYCFKCNAFGRVNRMFLEKLGIDGEILGALDKRRYNRVQTLQTVNEGMLLGTPTLDSIKVKYMKKRLGMDFTIEELERMRLVWDIWAMRPFIVSKGARNALPGNDNAIAFITEDRAVMVIRTLLDEEGQWRKMKLFPSEMKSFYTISTTINPFEKCIVNIAEGVFDIISVYKNFPSENAAYIATLVSDYLSAVDYAVTKGLVGNEVHLRIYVDADVNEKELVTMLKTYRWMFGSITTVRNVKSKDVGVPMDQIELVERTIKGLQL